MTIHFCRLISLFVFLFALGASNASAQQPTQVFALPESHAGEGYRVELETVLRERYGLRLESGARNAIIQWAFADGDLPAGISVRTDGTILGQPETSRADAYRFRLRVVDVSAKSDDLIVDFEIVVKPGRLRLSRIEGPRLVPVTLSSATAGGSSAALANGTISAPVTGKTTNEPKDGSSAPPTAPTETLKSTQETGATRTQNASVRVAEATDVQEPFSSLNKRFIVGFEQSGAASADSQGKPFFDLFINTPLTRSNQAKTAPFSIWGDVRLTSTPEQVKAFADVSSNAIGSITGGKLNQLGLGFDFVVGPEIRLRQLYHVDVGLIGGFGAVSPLSPKQSAQIFQVPDSASSQADAFFKKYPGAKGKQYIGFITPERDRFLRQYFGGVRFKSYSYTGAEELEDYFPAMLDVTFGQSEAVTGGRLHKFVLGIDGFYPLPFKDNDHRRFLYLFGSAKLKAGGPKTFATPFILDTAASSVLITDPKVFIADPTQTNRDVFRIGFGVDLVELFKH